MTNGEWQSKTSKWKVEKIKLWETRKLKRNQIVENKEGTIKKLSTKLKN